ncbi:acyl-CoA thioesterase [Thalassococcus lentus]|uniref:Acyl-CoA thioesterase n=1 Tax=Thalassococcus lentus TaxID=1210524 RepID=A0ABT4XV62_9RHOB|nr:acyl-CoA thioesterase [Thalassococcus lentus]MDA7425787.1 acyl-CoA thioesterase [Thalassococcus lentus]
MTRQPPGTRAQYHDFRIMPTRWMDNDEYGHMNNATYLSLVDTAVSLWQMDQGLTIRGADALHFLVVESGCRYHAEVGFPDEIHAGIRIAHLGRSSMRFEVGLFRNTDDQASTEAFFTQVYTQHGSPAPIPDHARKVFQTILV